VQSNALKTMTVGFPAPLLHRQSVKLRVTVNEPNVVQIVATRSTAAGEGQQAPC